MSSASRNAVVIGVGNSWAGDDGAGIAVARALAGHLTPGVRVVEHEGEPTALLDLWRDADLAIVVDAVSGSGEPGSVRVFDAVAGPLPSCVSGPSTHAFSVAQAIELGRSLGRLPPRLLFVGIEGRRFGAGRDLTPAVEQGVEEAARVVKDSVATQRRAARS
jgi:hydrogenase maturation protease